MTYAVTNDVGIDVAAYKAINAGVGPEVPEGLIVHLAIKLPEGSLRYIDVWESEQDCQRFEDDRLHPVVHRLVRQRLGLEESDPVPPEPQKVPLTVIHVIGAGGNFDLTG
jgi:hypothetical protein